MANRFISNRYQKDTSTAMGGSDVAAKAYSDCINLSLGDPDIRTDSIIIEAAYKDALAGHTKYTNFQGDPELIEEICKFYKEEYELAIHLDEVFITSSGCHAMYLVLEAILNDGEEVILQSPFFTPYPQQVKLARGIPVELPTYEEEDFQINMERLESLITDKTKALVINTPSNPTGNCLSYKTLKSLAEMAIKHDFIIIADDIYTAFSYQEKFIPIMSIPEVKYRVITINSFSKNFTMTGWRIGNIVAAKEIIQVIQRINENVVFTAPSVSQRAAIAALRNRKIIQPPMVEEYRKRVYYAAERINKIPGLKTVYPPRGSFYVFVNIKDLGMSSVEAADYFLKEAHVLTLPGIAFGDCGEGYLRIACVVGLDKLKEAFDRIEKAI